MENTLRLFFKQDIYSTILSTTYSEFVFIKLLWSALWLLLLGGAMLPLGLLYLDPTPFSKPRNICVYIITLKKIFTVLDEKLLFDSTFDIPQFIIDYRLFNRFNSISSFDTHG